MGTSEAMTEDEKCDWERCPGYPEDEAAGMVKREDGVLHPECDDAITHEEAAFWRRQWTGGAGIERIDAVLDGVFGHGDELRTAEHES